MADAVARRRRSLSVTLADVAELAGVSLATASKAMNGNPQVRVSTREKVLKAARELSFSPNPFAQALNSNRTGTIGVLTNDLESRFVLPIIMGAEDALGAGKTSVILCDARGDAIREQHHLGVLLAKRVDGVIVLGPSTNFRPSITAGVSVPLVYAYAPSMDPNDASFTPDNVQAGAMAVEHLLGRGRRSIALVNGDPSYGAARDRAQGAREALGEAGHSLVGGDALYGQWTENWGRECTKMLLQSGETFDAIIAGSDLIARGVLEQLRESGVRVPDDIAVLGFDNWGLLSETSRPALSTIDMNLELLGRRVAEELSLAINGEHNPGVHRLPVKLVPRESTASI
jgi:LacI family transcriptional regulator